MLSECHTQHISSYLPEYKKQAGAELGQAQLKLKLDFNLIFCRFGLIEMYVGVAAVSGTLWIANN